MNPQEFLDQMAATANALNLEEHMNLISKQVSVYGVPGFEVINYEDWFNQCKQEFEDKVLKNVSYEGLAVLEQSESRVMFTSLETVEGNDGKINEYAIEFVIQREEDGQWRVNKETVLPYAEFARA